MRHPGANGERLQDFQNDRLRPSRYDVYNDV